MELPVMLKLLEEAPEGAAVLEIGNVLGYYAERDWPVVDLFEKGPGILNVDAAEFRGERSYDLIVSISTLEHVGWDEHVYAEASPRGSVDSDKPLRVVENLRAQLAPGGAFVFSVPLGYNPHMDSMVIENRVRADRIVFMTRVGRSYDWREADAGDVAGTPYGVPGVHGASAIAVAFLTR